MERAAQLVRTSMKYLQIIPTVKYLFPMTQCRVLPRGPVVREGVWFQVKNLLGGRKGAPKQTQPCAKGRGWWGITRAHYLLSFVLNTTFAAFLKTFKVRVLMQSLLSCILMCALWRKEILKSSTFLSLNLIKCLQIRTLLYLC